MTEHLMPHVIAQSTAERHQQNSVEIKCHIAFNLPQQDHQCPQLVSSLDLIKSREEHFTKYYTIYSLYLLNLLVLII